LEFELSDVFVLAFAFVAFAFEFVFAG